MRILDRLAMHDKEAFVNEYNDDAQDEDHE